MIVPMLKYTFIAWHLDYEKFLDDIRNIGVLDIVEKISDPGSEIKEKLDQLKAVKQVYNFLEKQKLKAEAELKEFETEQQTKNNGETDKHIKHKTTPEIYSENEAHASECFHLASICFKLICYSHISDKLCRISISIKIIHVGLKVHDKMRRDTHVFDKYFPPELS